MPLATNLTQQWLMHASNNAQGCFGGTQIFTRSRNILTSYVLRSSIGSMGLVYLATLMVDVYGKLVGKYTSPMDPMGVKIG